MTLRTDAAIRERWETHSCEEVPADLACDLERENSKLRAVLISALRYVEAYEPRTRNGKKDQLDTIRTAKILLSALPNE